MDSVKRRGWANTIGATTTPSHHHTKGDRMRPKGSHEPEETNGYATFTEIAPTSIRIPWYDLLWIVPLLVAGLYILCWLAGTL